MRIPNCPAAGDTPKSNVVIRVIADQTAINDATAQPDATATNQRPASPALLLGHGVLPNALLAEAIRNGATVKPITMPSDQPEARYRPSAELAEFVRLRDMFCRFPGCDVPADRSDIDHARPWPLGPTHASNLNCKCRKHHLMKTFWTGVGGWKDIQLPDGPSSGPHPAARPTPPSPAAACSSLPGTSPPPTYHHPRLDVPPAGDRGLMMPRRQRTRAADQAARIKAERELNRLDIPPF